MNTKTTNVLVLMIVIALAIANLYIAMEEPFRGMLYKGEELVPIQTVPYETRNI